MHGIDITTLNTELMDDKDKMNFMVIKKKTDVELSNEIGKIFRGHNIIEYKSPDDSLNIDTFYKTQAYAGLYKSEENTLDKRDLDDITVSIIIESKPIELFKVLESENMKITMPYDGIYYINGKIPFETQVIVTDELSSEKHIWIKSLSNNMQMPDMKKLLNKTAKLKNDYEKKLANSVLETSLKANSNIVEELKVDKDISSTLLELVKPLIEKAEQKGAIRGAINALRSFGHSDEEIKTGIMKSYNLSEEEAEKYL